LATVAHHLAEGARLAPQQKAFRAFAAAALSQSAPRRRPGGIDAVGDRVDDA
jgi:hypothetical protein